MTRLYIYPHLRRTQVCKHGPHHGSHFVLVIVDSEWSNPPGLCDVVNRRGYLQGEEL